MNQLNEKNADFDYEIEQFCYHLSVHTVENDLSIFAHAYSPMELSIKNLIQNALDLQIKYLNSKNFPIERNQDKISFFITKNKLDSEYFSSKQNFLINFLDFHNKYINPYLFSGCGMNIIEKFQAIEDLTVFEEQITNFFEYEIKNYLYIASPRSIFTDSPFSSQDITPLPSPMS